MEESIEGEGGKSRKRVAVKGPNRIAAPAVTKVKATIHLSVDASRRLDIHCAMDAVARSAMVERLINDHLRRYVVSDRGGPGDDVERRPVRIAESEGRQSA